MGFSFGVVSSLRGVLTSFCTSISSGRFASGLPLVTEDWGFEVEGTLDAFTGRIGEAEAVVGDEASFASLFSTRTCRVLALDAPGLSVRPFGFSTDFSDATFFAALRSDLSWDLLGSKEALAFVGDWSSFGVDGTRAGKSAAESEGAGEGIEVVTIPRCQK